MRFFTQFREDADVENTKRLQRAERQADLNKKQQDALNSFKDKDEEDEERKKLKDEIKKELTQELGL